MSEKTLKIWGTKIRVFKNEKIEVDILNLKANTMCSMHKHAEKNNYFYVISGLVKIVTEFGDILLVAGEDINIPVKLIHQFRPMLDSVMLEIASVDKGFINKEDIFRYCQGGRVVDGKDITEDSLRKLGKLIYNKEDKK